MGGRKFFGMDMPRKVGEYTDVRWVLSCTCHGWLHDCATEKIAQADVTWNEQRMGHVGVTYIRKETILNIIEG